MSPGCRTSACRQGRGRAALLSRVVLLPFFACLTFHTCVTLVVLLLASFYLYDYRSYISRLPLPPLRERLTSSFTVSAQRHLSVISLRSYGTTLHHTASPPCNPSATLNHSSYLSCVTTRHHALVTAFLTHPAFTSCLLFLALAALCFVMYG